MSTIPRASPSSATVTSESPIRPILPSVRRSRSADLVGERGRGVDPMQLQQLDPFDAQASQGVLHLVAQHGRAAVERPFAGVVRACHSHLGGDQQAVRIRMERLGQEFLVGSAAVEVRRVDEGDPQLDGPAGERDGALAGRSRFRRQVHGPETEPPHLQVPSDTKIRRRHAWSSPRPKGNASTGVDARNRNGREVRAPP